MEYFWLLVRLLLMLRVHRALNNESKSKIASLLGAFWEIGWFLLLVFLASHLRPANFDSVFQNVFSGWNTCGSRYDFMRNCSDFEYHDHLPVEDRNVSYFTATGSGLSAKEFLDPVGANSHIVSAAQENFGYSSDLLSNCSATWRKRRNFNFRKSYLRSSPTTDHIRSNETRMVFVTDDMYTLDLSRSSVPDGGKLYWITLDALDISENSFDPRAHMILDYKQSYVRLPPPPPPPPEAIELQPEVTRDMCLQKGPTFKDPRTWHASEFSLDFFGSASRAIPALDESDDASPFDTRKRKLWWHLKGVSVTKEVKIVIYVQNALYAEKTYDTYFQIVPQFCNLQIDSDYVDVLSFTIQSLDGPYEYKEMVTSNSLEWHYHSRCGSCPKLTSNFNGFKTTSNSSSSKLRKFKSILLFIMFGNIALFIIGILIIQKVEGKNFVFFKYNIESNAVIDDSDSDSDEVDIEVGVEVDPNAEIIYENRNKGIVLESPRSQGSSGIVSTIMFFGVKCAMKIFHSNAKNDFRKEAATLFELEHPHIVKIRCAFGDSTIIMERMDKDLSKFIDSKRDHNNNNNYNLSLEVALEIMLQIAEGMSYLHQQGIAHGDLKSLNILLNVQGQAQDDNFKVTVKVADFGNARFFNPKNPKGFVLLPQTNIGSRPWRAPELFHQKRSFIAYLLGMYPYVMPKPLDIYGFGIICHELINGTYHRPPSLVSSDRCPEELVALVEDCCQINPHKRPEFDDIHHRLLELRSSLALNVKLNG